MPRLHALLRDKRARPLSVIELGAGCGIAGIALAQMVPHCSVFLTDLPEAQEMLQKNIDLAKPAPGSSLRRGLLAWGPVSSSSILQSDPDLVLISDCTYNADSCAALVQTLVSLAQHAKDIKILVAMKRRHDAEAVFEHMMDQNGFKPLECTKLAIPHRETEMDPSRPVVELYLYKWLDQAGNTSTFEACGVPEPGPGSSSPTLAHQRGEPPV
jgi:precorrin-6B methylase 2